MYPTYLMHYGIKGQKWGERRFQYEDGSLTPEGRRRYGVKDRDIRKIVKQDRKGRYNEAHYLYRVALNKNKIYNDYKFNSKEKKAIDEARENYKRIDREQNIRAQTKTEKKLGYADDPKNHSTKEDTVRWLAEFEKNKNTKEFKASLKEADAALWKAYGDYGKNSEKILDQILGENSNIKLSNGRTLKEIAISDIINDDYKYHVLNNR